MLKSKYWPKHHYQCFSSKIQYWSSSTRTSDHQSPTHSSSCVLDTRARSASRVDPLRRPCCVMSAFLVVIYHLFTRRLCWITNVKWDFTFYRQLRVDTTQRHVLLILLLIRISIGQRFSLTVVALLGDVAAEELTQHYQWRCAFRFWLSLCSHPSVTRRQNGIGIGSMCARTGGVLAPMMYLLKKISPQAPMVLCGLCPLLGSALTLLLPETANKPLPDTIEDVEGSDLRFDTTAFRPLFLKAQFT